MQTHENVPPAEYYMGSMRAHTTFHLLNQILESSPDGQDEENVNRTKAQLERSRGGGGEAFAQKHRDIYDLNCTDSIPAPLQHDR